MSKKSEPIISCHIHDYFEAACVRKARIRLILKTGEAVEGFAEDLITRDKNEILVVKVKNRAKIIRKEVPLIEILEMKLLVNKGELLNKIKL